MNNTFRNFILTCLLLIAFAKLQAQAPQTISWQDIAKLPPKAADKKIFYGSDSLQYGELRLPQGTGKAPVVVLIHGGCWLSQFNLHYMSHMAEALTKAGFITWSLEFRRVGDPGGGWPGTFQDVAKGTDFLRELAQQYPIDLSKVIVSGHSAGGHLALWLAARKNLTSASPVYSVNPLPLLGVVSLAGITDLETYGAHSGSCNAAVPKLMGGGAEEYSARYAQASPMQLLPLGVPQRLVQGSLDPIVPVEQSERYATKATALGDDAQQWLLEEAGHFDLVAPFSPVWPKVEKAFFSILPENVPADKKHRKKSSKR